MTNQEDQDSMEYVGGLRPVVHRHGSYTVHVATTAGQVGEDIGEVAWCRGPHDYERLGAIVVKDGPELEFRYSPLIKGRDEVTPPADHWSYRYPVPWTRAGADAAFRSAKESRAI